jgi:hypothetical protein
VNTVNKSEPARPWWLLPTGHLKPLWWIGIAAVLFGIDYITALYSLLPALYVIPVTMAAWYSGRRAALALAVGIPLTHIAVVLVRGTPPEPLAQFVAMSLVRGAVILVMALWFARLSEHERELQRHVQTLEGLLHICSFCKNIRNQEGTWERLEKVISERSDAHFSHGYCPQCIRTHYPHFSDDVAPGTLT